MKRSSSRPIAPLYTLLAFFAAIFVVTPYATTSVQKQRATESIKGHPAAASEVLVKIRGSVANPADAGSHGRGVQPGAQATEIDQIASEVEADHHRPVGGAGVRLFHSRRFTAAEMIERLAKRGNVDYVEPNYIVQVLQAPSDPQFPQLWGLQNVGQAVNGGLAGTAGADIHARSAWDVSTGSRDTVVGVVDTGIDYTHPDLAPNVWSAPAPFSVTLGGVTITCEAGTHGFNAITKTCDPMDDHNHGTHVSGTIGAVGNNSVGVVGVNWTTAIMGAKFIGADGSGTDADSIDAIEFVIQAKAAFASTDGANVRVLSNSYGEYSFSQAVLDEINRAADNDLLFVAAAGNNGIPNDLLPMYPASYNAPNVVAVAATDNADRRAYFSNYGANTVHLGAPGVDILSTTIGNTYTFFSGTSMATPHVSGAAALVLSKCSFDTAGLKAHLLATVDQVAGLSGATITGGRLNVDKALRACTQEPGVPDNLAATGGNAQVSLAWSPGAGATTYNVKRSTESGGPYTTVGSASAAAYVDHGVTNDVTYYYVVSGVNPLGESANSLEASATPRVPPDLVVSALTLPAAAAAGEAITVTDTTRNQGGGVAAASITRFYLSTNAAFDAADTLLDGSRAIPELAAGLSSAGSTSLTIPSGTTPGTRYIIAKADAASAVTETSETNNTLARSITIGPDLVVSALQVPSVVGPGAAVTVTDTVKNQGAAPAGASTIRFYVSANSVLDAADTPLQGSRAVAALAAGATSTGATQVTIPADLAVGRYYLVAKADADSAVAETSEANNTRASSIAVGPDLVVSAFEAPSKLATGSVVSLTDTVKNQGAGAAGASVTRFYLSANGTFDAADTLLEGSRPVPELAAGASNSGTTPVTIPPGLAGGTYYIFARTDADNSVAETYESNNNSARAVSIGPDLIVSSLVAPASVAPGSLVAVSDTAKNQGAGPAGPSTTRFYLSVNVTLDASDTLLDGSRAVPGLASGASSTGTAAVAIPDGIAAGTYFLIAKADADNLVAETSEANNTSVRSIKAGPDLVVSAMGALASTPAGGTVVVSVTTRNQGLSAAGASTTRFYLSANAAFDAGDTLLDGSQGVPALAAGASSTGSVTLTVPAGLAPGTWFILAVADADGTIAETTESNNTYVRSIAITAGT